MEFGQIKSKIEKVLVESYNSPSFKTNMFLFKELVLENKNISKIYFLYDELSSKKSLTESLATELINQSTNIYENTINKINQKSEKNIFETQSLILKYNES